MVLFNFYPVAKGGGLQNAYSFLIEMAKAPPSYNYLCVLRKGTGLEKLCNENNIPYIVFESGFWNRVKFELFHFYKLCKKFETKIIFSLFGSTPLVSSKCFSISGFARSNIIEKNVNFWNFLPFYKYCLKLMTDKVILSLMQRSDLIILETDRLARLAKEQNTFPNSVIKVIPMSPSSFVVEGLNNLSMPDMHDVDEVRVLYISGSHPNKNIHKLPLVFKGLNAQSRKGMKFKLVTTLPEGHYCNLIKSLFDEYSMADAWVNLGPVSSESLPDHILNMHALINVAELESFSNNWVEAWASQRLLICRDAEYARESCKKSSIYIDLEKPELSAKNIIDVFKVDNTYANYVNEGLRLVNSLPKPKEKYLMYMETINERL